MATTKEKFGFPERLLVTSYEDDHGKEADQPWMAYEAYETPEGVMVGNEMEDTEVAVYELVSIHTVRARVELSDAKVIVKDELGKL